MHESLIPVPEGIVQSPVCMKIHRRVLEERSRLWVTHRHQPSISSARKNLVWPAGAIGRYKGYAERKGFRNHHSEPLPARGQHTERRARHLSPGIRHEARQGHRVGDLQFRGQPFEAFVFVPLSQNHEPVRSTPAEQHKRTNQCRIALPASGCRPRR